MWHVRVVHSPALPVPYSGVVRRLFVLVLCLLGPAAPVRAQQPFVTDDAAVSPGGVWHVEISGQAEALRASARPARLQHTFEWEVDRTIGTALEVGVLVPHLMLVSDRAGGGHVVIGGVGDSALAAKYRLTRDPAARTSWAASATVEWPTGARHRGLGSGLVDYGANLIGEWRVDARTTLRVNAGGVVAGNTQVGALGIKARGPVLTAGTSLVTAFSSRVQAGAELTGAWSQKAVLAGSTVGWQVGANVTVHDGVTLDLGLLGGWFESSPRLGVQVGTSIDWRP